MSRIAVNIKKIHAKAVIPTYGSVFSAGADLYACLDEAMMIAPGKTVMIPTGLTLEIPEAYAGLVCARSGLASKKGLAPANKVGVIDSDYRDCYLLFYFTAAIGRRAAYEIWGDCMCWGIGRKRNMQ